MSRKIVTIYTDGGCLGNPGPGGYGGILVYKNNRKELSGGYRKTTNNRMELMACIEGLKALKYACKVTVYSDSRYVVDGISKGWAKRWKKNGWMRNRKESAVNIDLWDILLSLCKIHEIEFKWVKGHAGHVENERCDALAKKMSTSKNLPTDTVYENGMHIKGTNP
ncbi:ribonuclease HI [Desulfobacterales bacterium HSG16]|nr:ribonuclease HI [Desulfobacterales bacterium HSG16]